MKTNGVRPLFFEAALAAGIFHREEVPISAVKDHMRGKGIERRDR